MFTKMKRNTRGMVCLLGVSALFTANMQAKAVAIVESQIGAGQIVKSANAGYVHSNLSISKNGSATVSGNAVGKQGTSKIKVIVKLQRYDSSKKTWNTLKTYENERNMISASVEKTYKLSAKGTYRSKCVAMFTKSGKTETVTSVSEKKQYK